MFKKIRVVIILFTSYLSMIETEFFQILQGVDGGKKNENRQNTNCSNILPSVLTLQSGVPTDTIARRINVKRVGKGEHDEARCFCSFLVVLACENDTSNFSLFSSLPPCNAIFRFQAVGFRVEIENCIFLMDVRIYGRSPSLRGQCRNK